MGGFNCPQTFARAFDNNGAPAPGAKLYAFLAGTTIPKNLYFDFDLTQPCPHPLVADSDGNFEQYFLEGGAYKLSLFDQDDNQLRPPEEPIYGTGAVSADTLSQVIADSAEIVWTEDEGDQISGHLVWPLSPPIGDYFSPFASIWKTENGGLGYGSDVIVAKQYSESTPESYHGIRLGYNGMTPRVEVGDLNDGTRIEFQPDIGGSGIDAHGVGAFKFDSLRVGDLAGGGANPLPLARDNDGDLVPRTAAEFRGDIGAQESGKAVLKTGVSICDDAAILCTDSTIKVVNTELGTCAGMDASASGGAVIYWGRTDGPIEAQAAFDYGGIKYDDLIIANNIGGGFVFKGTYGGDGGYVRIDDLSGSGSRPIVADGNGTLAAQDAATFRGTIGVSVADGQVARGTTGGAVTSDAGLTTTQSGGVTDSLGIGNGSGSAYARVNAAAGNNSSMYLQNGGVNRWGMIRVATSNAWWLRAYDAAGSAIDNPIEIVNALGGAITLGGGAATKRDVNLTKDLQLSGTTRLSAAGRIDITSLYNSAWAGAGIRPLLTDNVGMGYATDALTFRGAIGVKERAYAQIYRTGAAATQSIPTGTAYTKITPFNANDADYLDATPDQANDRIVIGRAGRYHIVFSRSFSVGTANTTWLSAVLKNGTAVPASIQQVKMVNATTSTYATSDCQVTCAAGDVITFGVQHGNGSAVDMTYDYSTLYVDALD